MTGRRFTTKDKILIVMEYLETDIKISEALLPTSSQNSGIWPECARN